MMVNGLVGFAAAGLFAFIAYAAGALTRSGLAAATFVGGAIFAFGGAAWGSLLGVFFVSSSLLSFFKASDQRKQRAALQFAKTGKRDAGQVLANGGVAALAAVLLAFSHDPSSETIWAGAFVGAIAAATADTWATELGVLSSARPRLITNWKHVAAGTSGAITLVGTIAAAGGSLLIGVVAVVLQSLTGRYASERIALLLSALVGGMTGALFDSLLGATVQAAYSCPGCGIQTESPIHSCGTEARLLRGFQRMNNDLVNFASTAAGAIAACTIAAL